MQIDNEKKSIYTYQTIMLNLKLEEGFKGVINALQKLQGLCRSSNQGKITIKGKIFFFGALNQKLEIVCQIMQQFDYLLDENNNFSLILQAFQKQFIEDKAIICQKMQNVLEGNYEQIEHLLLDYQNNPKMYKQMIKQLRKIDQRLHSKINIIEYLPNLQLSNEFVFQQMESLEKAFSFYNQTKNIHVRFYENQYSFKISQQSLKQPLSNYLQYYEDLYDQVVRNIYSFKYQTVPQKIKSFFRNLEKLASNLFPQKYQNIKVTIFSKEICKDFNIKWPSFEGKSITDRICIINQTFREQTQDNFENTVYLYKKTSVLYIEYYYKYFDQSLRQKFLAILKNQQTNNVSLEIQQHSINKGYLNEKGKKEIQQLFKSKPQKQSKIKQNYSSKIIKKLIHQCYKKQLNKLTTIFTESKIDYKQLKGFFKNHKKNPEVIEEIMKNIKKYDFIYFEKINGMKYSKVSLFQGDNQKLIRLLRNVYIFYDQITDIIQGKIEKKCLNLSIQLFKLCLNPFVEDYEHFYKKIMQNICMLMYLSIPQMIENFFDNLEYLVSKIFPEDYSNIKNKIQKMGFNKDFNLKLSILSDKSITYRICKYNQTLRESIEADFTKVIAIFQQSSAQYYNYLDERQKKHYIQLLRKQFERRVQKYLQDAENGDQNEECLIDIFKVIPQQSTKQCFEEQFQEIKGSIKSKKDEIERTKNESSIHNFEGMAEIYQKMNKKDQKKNKSQLIMTMKADFQQITNAKTSQTERIQSYRQICNKYKEKAVDIQGFVQRYQEFKLQAEKGMLSEIQNLINQNTKQLQNIDTTCQINELIENNKVITYAYIQFIQDNIKIFQKILIKMQEYFEIVIFKHSKQNKFQHELFTIYNWQFQQVLKQLRKQYFRSEVAKLIINQLKQNKRTICIHPNSEKIQKIVNYEYKNECLQKIASQLLQVHKQISNICLSEFMSKFDGSTIIEQSKKQYLQEIRLKINLLMNIEQIYNKYGLNDLKIEGNTNNIGSLQPFKKIISKEVQNGFQQIQRLQNNPEKQLSIRFNLIYSICQMWMGNNSDKEKDLVNFMNRINNDLDSGLQKIISGFQSQVDLMKMPKRNSNSKSSSNLIISKLPDSQLQFCQDQKNIERADKIISNLVVMQKMQDKLPFYQQIHKEKGAQIVKSIKSIRYLLKLIISEMKHKFLFIPEIKKIASKYVVFKSIINKQIPLKDLQTFLQQFKGKNQKYEQYNQLLFQDYSYFQSSFKRTIDKYDEASVKMISNDIRESILKKSKSQVLGKIFGLYAILRNNNSGFISFKPHPSQFIAVTLLLSFQLQQKEEVLNRNVFQMLPGQGKSVVLAIVACYLALKNYNIYVITFSSYLVKRDYEEFKPLFQVLNIQMSIKYSVIDQFCRYIYDNSTLKQKVNKWLFNQHDKKMIQHLRQIFTQFEKYIYPNPDKNIILVDQIDILFSDNFEGKVYEPILQISDEGNRTEIKDIFRYIYNKSRKQYLTFASIQKTNVYQNLIGKYSFIQLIIKQQIVKMLNDVLNQFEIQKNYLKIINLYKQQGKENDSQKRIQKDFIGYQQCFAYLKASQQNKINDKTLRNNIKIYLKVGQLSYSKLFKNFGKIIGVSGVLKHLSEIDKQLLCSQYKIDKIYQLPSIFIKSQLILSKYIFTCQSKRQFYNKIFQSFIIKQKINSTIVIFKDEKSLIDFNKVAAKFQMPAAQLQFNVLMSSLLIKNADLSINIEKVASPNVLTFVTKQFARGIEYKPYNQAEGLSIIQTFLPETPQDYYQAIGRTAGSKKPGNFKLIIQGQQLKDIQKGQQRFMDQKQQNFWIAKNKLMNEKRQKIRKQAKEMHERTTSKYTKGKIIQYIYQINPVSVNAKTQTQMLFIFGFQGNLIALENHIQLLVKMLQRCEDCIKKHQLGIKLKYQVCYYGNYTNYNVSQIPQHQAYQRIFKTSKICQLCDFIKELKRMKPLQKTNKIKYLGESVQLFFKHVSELSFTAKVTSCFVWSFSRNYNWKIYKQTNLFEKYQLSIKKSLNIKNDMKTCKQYLEDIKSKNISMQIIGLSIQVGFMREINQLSNSLIGKQKSALLLKQSVNFEPQITKFFFQRIKQAIPQLRDKQI